MNIIFNRILFYVGELLARSFPHAFFKNSRARVLKNEKKHGIIGKEYLKRTVFFNNFNYEMRVL